MEETALALPKEKKPLRPLQTNVEFYTALVLEAVGVPRDSFTNVFAAGRMGAGPPMCWNRSGQGGSFAHNPAISVRIRGEILRSIGEYKIPPAFIGKETTSLKPSIKSSLNYCVGRRVLWHTCREGHLNNLCEICDPSNRRQPTTRRVFSQ